MTPTPIRWNEIEPLFDAVADLSPAAREAPIAAAALDAASLAELRSLLRHHDAAGGVRPFTPRHASPEPVRGEPVTAATDLHSLGVLRCQMLTGARPTGRHAISAAEAARSVLEQAPILTSRLSPDDGLDPQ